MGQTVGNVLNVPEYVFPPLPASYDETHEFLVRFPSGGEADVPAMLIPPGGHRRKFWENPSSLAGRTVNFCVIYFHPNACDIGDSLGDMISIRDGVFGGDAIIVAPEYSGYGLLGDYQPSVESIDLVAMAAWRYCRRVLGFSGSRIVLWGRSIGTGPSSSLARSRARRSFERYAALKEEGAGLREEVFRDRRPVGGLVLVAPFTSVQDVVHHHTNVLVASLVNPFWSVKDIVADPALRSVPLCVAHPEEDEVVPLEHGQAVLDAAAAEKKQGFWLEGMTHNCGLQAIHLDSIRDFIHEHVLSDRAPKVKRAENEEGTPRTPPPASFQGFSPVPGKAPEPVAFEAAVDGCIGFGGCRGQLVPSLGNAAVNNEVPGARSLTLPIPSASHDNGGQKSTHPPYSDTIQSWCSEGSQSPSKRVGAVVRAGYQPRAKSKARTGKKSTEVAEFSPPPLFFHGPGDSNPKKSGTASDVSVSGSPYRSSSQYLFAAPRSPQPSPAGSQISPHPFSPASTYHGVASPCSSSSLSPARPKSAAPHIGRRLPATDSVPSSPNGDNGGATGGDAPRLEEMFRENTVAGHEEVEEQSPVSPGRSHRTTKRRSTLARVRRRLSASKDVMEAPSSTSASHAVSADVSADGESAEPNVDGEDMSDPEGIASI